MTLDDIACAHWPTLAKHAGMPDDGWVLFAMSIREDAERSRAVYRAIHKDAGEFTYHYQHKPEARSGFENHYKIQAKAADAFPVTAAEGISQPKFLDPVRMASLSVFVEGEPLSVWMDHFNQKPNEQLKLLTKAGSWLSRFHRAQIAENRDFETCHALNYYNALRSDIEQNRQRVAAKPLYLKGIDTLSRIAARYDGRPTISAAQHGDFHMRNLIYDGTCLTGIDISRDESGPIGYDIAKILLDFTTVVYGPKNLNAGEVVAQPVRDAFFAGYDLVAPDDPSVNFLLYARILATLYHVPQRKGDRTDAKQRTLQRLRPIAQKAFDIP